MRFSAPGGLLAISVLLLLPPSSRGADQTYAFTASATNLVGAKVVGKFTISDDPPQAPSRGCTGTNIDWSDFVTVRSPMTVAIKLPDDLRVTGAVETPISAVTGVCRAGQRTGPTRFEVVGTSYSPRPNAIGVTQGNTNGLENNRLVLRYNDDPPALPLLRPPYLDLLPNNTTVLPTSAFELVVLAPEVNRWVVLNGSITCVAKLNNAGADAASSACGNGEVAAPLVESSGVVNGASFQAGFGGNTWVTIRGQRLSETTRSWEARDFRGNQLPTELDGVQVKINGRSAYVAYISPTQINVLTPDDATAGVVPVEILRTNGPSQTVTVRKESVAPALFAYSQLGGRYAVAQSAAFEYIAPAALLGAGATTRPANPGETLVLYATGLGPTSPAAPAGQTIAAPLPVAGTVEVTLGGQNAPVRFAGLIGPGLYQLNIVVPPLPPGDAALVVRANGGETRAATYIQVLGPAQVNAQPGTYRIRTFAGGGAPFGNSGDGGPALGATLVGPNALKFDAQGNLFVSELSQVRRIAPNGVITLAFGRRSGEPFGEDGAQASRVQFGSVQGLAFDRAGNAYLGDWTSSAVYRISPAGIVTRFAGTGVRGPSGDGGNAVVARLSFPRNIALDAAENLYIADNLRVRRVDRTGVINSLPALVHNAEALAIGPNGDVFVAGSGGGRSGVSRISPTGQVTLIAGGGASGNSGDGGPAINASFGLLWSIAVDAAGAVYVGDSQYHTVRRIDPSGVVTRIAGGGTSTADNIPAREARFSFLSGLTIDAAGNLYVSDSTAGLIRVLRPE